MYFFTIFFVILLLKDAASYPNKLNFNDKNSVPDGLNHNEITEIVGGRNITINRVKYTGSVIADDEPIGSLVILNKLWVLTAAYNVYGFTEREITIRVGSNFNYKEGVEVGSKKIIIHENYTGNWDFDIALIKLKKPLKFTNKINSISISSSLPQKGSDTILSGYGLINETTTGGYLQQTKLPFVDYETCKEYYAYVSGFTPNNFCTLKDGAGPCYLDWGSPLVYKEKLIGLFVGSYGCASTTYPSIYIDVTKFKDWITKIIKENE